MIYKSSRSLHFHLIIFLTICFTTSVKSDLHGNYEQEDIIRELKQLTKKCGIFYGCKFSLLDSNLPEHKDYYSKLKSNDFISVPLWEKLYYRLNPDNLIYFHSFKERINILRQYAPLKKVISDYCLLYTRDFNTLKTPLDKGRYQRYYEEDTTECNQNYENYCISIDELEKRIDEDFLRYYNLGYSSYTYNISKEIYDHGLVHYCKGNIVESLKLAGDLIELVNKEGPNLKKHLSDARNFFFPDATFIEAMKYSKVIDFLSKSIEKNPSNDATFFS